VIINPFVFARTPNIIFGRGRFKDVASIASGFGRRALVVTGGGSLIKSGRWDELCALLDAKGVEFERFVFSGEPSPEDVDRAVAMYRGGGIEVVLAVGGGSVIDGGKAISAMLPSGNSTLDYLEGVGTHLHDGRKTPFIAVPTTAGTGSEATKNAVLSRIGRSFQSGQSGPSGQSGLSGLSGRTGLSGQSGLPSLPGQSDRTDQSGGFKKSLRHDNFVPDVALVDPELTLSCPPDISAACGMDAFVQLLESYVSVKASPFTDALCESALPLVGRSLAASCTHGAGDIGVRADMSYAATVSGITLANAGLGLVHGFASALGGFCNAPHGVICGTLIGSATAAVVAALRRTGGAAPASKSGTNAPAKYALAKYARAGALLTGRSGNLNALTGATLTNDTLTNETLVDALIETIDTWTSTLNLPRLGLYGVGPGDIEKLAFEASNKEAPVKLSPDEIAAVLGERI
jgi:alcohol dehydrogenase class IV